MSKIKEILFNCLKRINIQIFVFLFFLIATFIVSFFRIEKKNDFIYEPYRVLCGIYFFLCLFYPIIYIATLVFVKKEYIKKILLFLLYLVTFYLSFFCWYCFEVSLTQYLANTYTGRYKVLVKKDLIRGSFCIQNSH